MIITNDFKMNKCKLISYCFLLFCSITMAQVGMPTSEPKGALDLNTTTNTNTYGLVLPTTDNPKQKIRNPNENNNLTRVEGTMIYDSRQDCVRIFQKGSWSNCLCTKGDEGCLDYFPGQGGGLEWLVIGDHGLGKSGDLDHYSGTDNSHFDLERQDLFSTTGIYNKFSQMHIGLSMPYPVWQPAGNHANNFVELNPSFILNPGSYLDKYKVASVSTASLGQGSDQTYSKVDAVIKFGYTDKNIIFISLFGDADRSSPRLFQAYGFRSGFFGQILGSGQEYPLYPYDGDDNILEKDRVDYSNGPYFKFDYPSLGEPGIESILHTPSSHIYVPMASLPVSTPEYPVKVYAVRKNGNDVYAAVFSVGNTYFFDSHSMYGQSIYSINESSGQVEIDKRRKRYKLKNLIRNVVSIALDNYEIN